MAVPAIPTEPPSPPAKTVPDVPPKSRTRRIALYVLGSLGGLLVVLGILTAIFWSQIARALVERAAASRGVDLKAKDVSLSLTSAHITDVDAKLASSPGIHLHADAIDVELSWFTPTKVHLHKLALEADDPRALVDFVDAAHGPAIGSVPGDADGLSLHVKKLSAAAPVAIDLTAAKATHDGAETKVVGIAGTIPVSGAPFGPYDLFLAHEGTKTTITTTALPTVKVAIDRAKHHVDVALDSTDVPGLAFLASDHGKLVALSGTIGIDVPDASASSFAGTIDATLQGVSLPHPKELDGVLSGDALKLSADFELTSSVLDAKKLKLSEGPLALGGEAHASLAHGGHFDTTLEGTVACGAIAGSVVSAKLDSNPLASILASHAVSGDIAVKLKIVVDAPDWKPHVDPTVDVRCGLGL